MTKMKYIFKNISILNVFLISAIVLMVDYSVLPLLNVKIKFMLPVQEKTRGKEDAVPSEHHFESPSDYMIISEENLFHPERRIPPEKKAEQELPKPEIVLYGTMVSDDFSVAFLEDLKAQRTTPGRGKRQIALKKGDMLSGFILREIASDQIVMVRGEDKIVINMIDPSKPKTREVITKASAQTKQGQTVPPSPLPAASKPQKPAKLEDVIKKEPPPKTRAPMTQTDEKVLDFFKRN